MIWMRKVFTFSSASKVVGMRDRVVGEVNLQRTQLCEACTTCDQRSARKVGEKEKKVKIKNL